MGTITITLHTLTTPAEMQSAIITQAVPATIVSSSHSRIDISPPRQLLISMEPSPEVPPDPVLQSSPASPEEEEAELLEFLMTGCYIRISHNPLSFHLLIKSKIIALPNYILYVCACVIEKVKDIP